LKRFLSFIPILFIRLYQYTISSWTPPTCRFTPTCSNYTIDAIKIHGVLRGIVMGFKRISKCRPGGGSGFDPVPEHLHGNTVNKTKD
jgi:putative membrane protein insertion efficiency factor